MDKVERRSGASFEDEIQDAHENGGSRWSDNDQAVQATALLTNPAQRTAVDFRS
ncbi:hypothetical protein DVH05_002647 [Phytophthora capsici]|nr:hypothetical protein DVH05_002647 [Phytophthora capsici]